MAASENVIAAPPSFHITDVREITKSITHLVEFRGYDRIVLDFSGCNVAFAEALVPMVCLCQKMRDDGVRFELRLPISDRLSRLFLNCGWANLIAPRHYPERGTEVGDNIPAIVFRDHIRQDDIVNNCMDRILRRIHKLRRENLRALEWSVNEICDNVLNHSESAIGGVFQLNFRSLSREVEFIVADAGIGIPASLRSVRNKDWSDEFALEKSIEQGVTRDPSFGQGNGLFGTFQIATISGGTFHINSGFAHLVATRGGLVRVQHDNRHFLGTVVVCAVNFSNPQLLEQALSFKSGASLVPRHSDFDSLAVSG